MDFNRLEAFGSMVVFSGSHQQGLCPKHTRARPPLDSLLVLAVNVPEWANQKLTTLHVYTAHPSTEACIIYWTCALVPLKS